jgi:DNA-binding response OmpR family regulator
MLRPVSFLFICVSGMDKVRKMDLTTLAETICAISKCKTERVLTRRGYLGRKLLSPYEGVLYMKEQIQLDGLLYTRDASVQQVMTGILDNFAILTQVSGEVEIALDAVTHRRLDAVIVDWDGAFDPTRVVRAARKSSPNANSTIVAMVSEGSETLALLVGANFMIHKPTDVEHARRCMRAAYGTMLQNRRRAARIAVDLPVVARVADLGEIEARISDLSIGGLALHCTRPLKVNQQVMANFSLPNNHQLIHVTGSVVNANSTGRVGIRFSFVPEEERVLLENWLAVELAKLEKAEMPVDSSNPE